MIKDHLSPDGRAFMQSLTYQTVMRAELDVAALDAASQCGLAFNSFCIAWEALSVAKLTGHAPEDGEDNVAGHVQIEREARGWSTAELARRVTEVGCPMSQSAVWRIENGTPRRKITVDELIAFSKVFGRSIEYLLKPARPEYPNDLIRAHLNQWCKQELAVWLADTEASYAFSDLMQMAAIYPGSVPHLSQLLEEMLEESHTTFLRHKMHARLKGLPQQLADLRRDHLFNPLVLIAYWKKFGLSLDAMSKQAAEWGFGDLSKSLRRGFVNVKGKRTSIAEIELNGDGSIKIVPNVAH